MNILQEINGLRARGWSLEKVSRKLEVSYRSVWKWTHGDEISPNMKELLTYRLYHIYAEEDKGDEDE